MKLILSIIALSLGALPAHSADLAKYTGELAALGVDAAALPETSVPEVRAYPARTPRRSSPPKPPRTRTNS